MKISYSADTHFPIQNIPFGVFSVNGNAPCVGSRIGDKVVNLATLARLGIFNGPFLKDKAESVFTKPALNAFMALGKPAWKEARETIQKTFQDDSVKFNASEILVDADKVQMHMPAEVGDYTDFYASKEHATNVGIMFRGKENALMPNWTHLPVGYHGRASSLVVSGTGIRRPHGQRNIAPKGEQPKVVYGPSVRMDFELEMAFFIGVGNNLGDQINIDQAKDFVFGVALMNDWSARDIQAWEYVPLGPFLGKNFGTTISPWVVTLDALEPFMVPGPVQNPEPLAYLKEKQQDKSAIDVNLEVHLKRLAKDSEWNVISKTNLKYMYWSISQQVAHHTVNGCNLRPGDVLATGTISGPTPDSYGSLLELSWTGTKPLTLKSGLSRTFLEDGDELKLTGWAQGDGYRIGFGECTGIILPATTK